MSTSALTASRRTRKSVIAGLVLLILLELLARFLAPRLPGQLVWDTEFSQVKSHQIEEIGAVDIGLLGSSIVNAGLDGPTITEQVPWASTSYNAGLPATTPRTWEIWAQDLVFPDLCPNLVLIGVSVRDVNDRNTGAADRLVAYEASVGRQALYGNEPTTRSLEERVGRWSAFVRIRSRLREPGNVIKYFFTGRVESWPDPDLTPTGRYRGFDEKTYEQDAARDEDLVTGALADFTMGGVEFAALEAIIEELQDLGSTVVLVEMPSMEEDLATLLPSGAPDRFSALVAELAARHTVPVWQVPELDNRADRFADHYHPNGQGTQELSRLLGVRIASEFPAGVPDAQCGPR